MKQLLSSLTDSWLSNEGIHKTQKIIDWVQCLNQSTHIEIIKTKLSSCGWFYDESTGQIVNGSRSFFSISGLCYGMSYQPIIIQDEIGFLGILAKKIDGLLHILMQAKIEPGNVNKIQISPTIQATKSNFTKKHGGATPAYLDFFLEAHRHTIVVDQIQSEQSSRFLKKRNRNIMIVVDENTAVPDSHWHKWMTIGQIKALMKIDNLVNMDTRTVLACIPFHQSKTFFEKTNDLPLANSLKAKFQHKTFKRIYHHINNRKMFSYEKRNLMPLYELPGWRMSNNGTHEVFASDKPAPFKIIFCDITIDGREVRKWGQPLFEAVGMATFGLFTSVCSGVREFLVHAKTEVGAFDHIELGPSVQLEPDGEIDTMADVFLRLYKSNTGIKHDVVLSDEVIVPSFTFTSTATAFMRCGATPVFCDIRPDTLNIDEALIEILIGEKTKAIFVIHYAGIPCEMDTVLEIANRHGLVVVEDAAQAVGSTYKGKPAGTLTALGCFSFHETKNYVMGEGGALIINDERYTERAEIIREKGTNRSNVIRGLVDKYTWYEVGSSFLPSDVLAAILYAQMERFDEIMEKRLAIWNTYHELLEPLEQRGVLRRLHVPQEVIGNGHMYNIILPAEEIRGNLIDKLREAGVISYIAYVPLHSSPMGKKLSAQHRPLLITDDIGSKTLRLPMYADMKAEDAEYVVGIINKHYT